MKSKPYIRFALALFVWALLFSVKSILTVACAVLLHECAHIAACLALGVKIYGVTPLPWGLTVAAPVIYDRRAQVIISAAGPAFSLFLLVFCAVLKLMFNIESGYFDLFMLSNLAEGFLNLIPALPLDGGIILKSHLCAAMGLARGFRVSLKITAAIGAVVFAFGLLLLIVTGCNFSYAAAGLFILVNLKHERELLMCVKKRVLTGEVKSSAKIKCVTVNASCRAVCLANLISCSHTLVFLVNRRGRFVGLFTQEELLDGLLENSLVTAGECVFKKPFKRRGEKNKP